MPLIERHGGKHVRGGGVELLEGSAENVYPFVTATTSLCADGAPILLR